MSPAYELGRARGYVTGRTVPTESDRAWCEEQTAPSDVAFMLIDWPAVHDDFATGMLDGAEQAATQRLGLPCLAAPSAEALAAAREGVS